MLLEGDACRKVAEGVGTWRHLGETMPHRGGRRMADDGKHVVTVRVAGAAVARKQERTRASEWMGE